MATVTSSPYAPDESSLNHQDLTNFQEYVDERCKPGMDGHGASKEYITFEDLKRYWTPDNIDQLLISLRPPFVVSRDEVNKIIERFLRVLSILTYTGKVGYFQWFFRHNHDDTRLPHEGEPYDLPRVDEMFPAFSRAQWRFCPFDFINAPYMRPLDPHYILPITILKGLSPPTADSSRPVIQKVLRKSIWRREDEGQVVVFKTYNGVEGNHLWETEFMTYQAITQPGPCNHIVKCLGSFRYKETDKYTIILEYADGGTLLDLFKEGKFPVLPADRIQLWERLFELLIGLKRIHGLQSDRDSKNLMSLKCIHLDIKPANILVFRDKAPSGARSHNCRFKLADFGSSPARALLAGQDLKAEDTGGTPMYSAPELCRDFQYLKDEIFTATPHADIWSLGCVFSEVLVWTIMGEEDGRREYERRRVEATKSVPRITQAGYGGCFHTVDSRLVVVDSMHEEAKQYLQQGDKITPLVSEFILKRMLRPDREDRLPPTNLHRMFEDEVREIKRLNVPSGTRLVDEVASHEQAGVGDVPPSRDRKPKTWTPRPSSNDDRHPPLPSSSRAPIPTMNPQARNPARILSAVLPNVTVADVLKWKSGEGGKRPSRFFPGGRSLKDLEGSSNLKQLAGRDQYFIIDDSPSMRDHWKEVIDTFQALASLVKLVDDDGLDLYFASSPKKMHHNKHSGPLVDIIKKQRLEQPCMMNLSLDAMTEIIIEKHLGFRVHRRRPVSVFVLTNGNWGLGGVDKSVERLVRELDKHDTADSFVALQFVRFGSLPEGIRRLKKLDNLGKPSSKNPSKKVLSRDIVDHSSCNDSVWKMLIGSLVDGVDNDSDDDSDMDEGIGYVKS